MVTVLALGKAVGSREMVCISHAPLALLPAGKGSPSPTLQRKLFWPVSLARCLIYLQSCCSVGSGPEVGHIFASHPSILTTCISPGSPQCEDRREEGVLLTGGESFY